MVITKEVETTWCPSNKRHFESKGYKFTKMADKFSVTFEDMPHSSDKFVEIQCDYCGEKFNKQIKKYYIHRENIEKDCCNNCRAIKSQEVRLMKYGTLSAYATEKAQKLHSERCAKKRAEIYEKMKDICKERDYELLSKEFVSNDSYIEYICNKHREKGTLKITWNKLYMGRGCKYCGRESSSDIQRKSFDEVKKIIESSGKHKLISTEYTAYNDYNLEITCEECDNTFVTNLGFFMKGRHLCNECNASSGERAVINYLRANNIKYSHEHQIYIEGIENPYRFDFYLEQYNLAIEYDGEQHYEPIRFDSGSMLDAERNFKDCQRRDMLKDEYCKENNIALMRIPYWEKENISNILDDFFKSNSRKFIVATNIL